MSDPIQLEPDVMGQIMGQVSKGQLGIKRGFALIQSEHGQWYVYGQTLDKLRPEDAVVALGLAKQWLLSGP